ncbi:MAG: thymidylate kinase, partial [Coriobacteriia bacterium]|nr:thymidylate kinase [Coriobacteriia bacterium]
DLTIMLDLDPAEGLTRATYAGTDRLEAEEAEFHVRVRKGFLAIAAEEPERVVVIDASVDVETVALEVRRAVMTLPVIAAMLPKDAE